MSDPRDVVYMNNSAMIHDLGHNPGLLNRLLFRLYQGQKPFECWHILSATISRGSTRPVPRGHTPSLIARILSVPSPQCLHKRIPNTQGVPRGPSVIHEFCVNGLCVFPNTSYVSPLDWRSSWAPTLSLLESLWTKNRNSSPLSLVPLSDGDL